MVCYVLLALTELLRIRGNSSDALDTGDSDGRGNVRKEELLKSYEILGVSKEYVKTVQHKWVTFSYLQRFRLTVMRAGLCLTVWIVHGTRRT